MRSSFNVSELSQVLHSHRETLRCEKTPRNCGHLFISYSMRFQQFQPKNQWKRIYENLEELHIELHGFDF